MLRLFLWLGLGYLVFRLFRDLLLGGRLKAQNRPRAGSRSGGSEKMVKCASCGLYVPEHEALSGGGPAGGKRHYCSPECRRQAG
ncbi:MAG TPA: hypothetical protein ENN66_10365 [Proteobacteria bacterium]|nr:hypothetical protein [Pseudomonadota bacterium]